MQNEGRPVPDEGIIRRALRVRERTESPMERYIRDEHAAMIGAARIGMDAARKLWPIEKDHLPVANAAWGEILKSFEQTYLMLDGLAEIVHGDLVQDALLGKDILVFLEAEEERLRIGPKHEPQATEAPAISGHHDDSSTVPGDGA